MNKALNLLGLMVRAKKIITGEDLIIKELRDKKVSLLLISEDCGKNTKKKLYDKSKYYNTEVIECFKAEEISKAIGRENRVAVAILDKGFSIKFKELIKQGGYINNEEN